MERHRRASIFVLLMGYTGMLYTLSHLVAVEIVLLANCPALRFKQSLEALSVLLLLVAGICLATSDFANNCGFEWHCHNLRVFRSVSLVRTFQTSNEQVHKSIDVQLQDLVPCHRA